MIPTAALSLVAFFDFLAVAALLKKNWLASRTGKELSSWAYRCGITVEDVRQQFMNAREPEMDNDDDDYESVILYDA